MVALREVGSIVAIFLFFLLLAMLVVALAGFMREVNESLASILLPLFIGAEGVVMRGNRSIDVDS